MAETEDEADRPDGDDGVASEIADSEADSHPEVLEAGSHDEVLEDAPGSDGEDIGYVNPCFNVLI